MTTESIALPSLYAFPESWELASAIAARLGVPLREIEIHDFPDGESLVRVETPPSDRALIIRSLDDPNRKLLEVLFAADALRREGAATVGLVAPYLSYMRQDRVFRSGEPISQRVVAGLLDAAFDQVLTVEAHLHRIHRLSEIFQCPAESVSAAAPIADWLRARGGADLVVGPDSESEPWIREIAKRAGIDWCVGSKTRRSDRDVRIELPPLASGIRSAWVVDDIASSGGTLESIVHILKQRGVAEVGGIVVHALFQAGTQVRLQQAGLHSLLSTDGIPHETNAISLAGLLAEKIREFARRAEDA